MVAASATVGLAFFGFAPIAVAADPPPPSSNQGSSSNLVYKKSVVGSNVVHPGDEVTFKLEVSKNGGVDRGIRKLRDIPPTGFQYVNGSGVVNKQASITVEGDGSVSTKCSDGGCNGWLGGNFGVGGALTFELKYKVPENMAPGIYDSGMLYDVYAFSTVQGQNPFNVKVQVVPEDVATTTSLAVPATAVTGAAVDLTATVDPANAVGSVQFRDNGTDIGGPVAVANGVAVLPHTFDAAGAHAITAEFVAGAGFVSSSAAAQTVTVTAPDATTTTTVTVPADAVTGAAVNLLANVGPANAVGTVQFKDNGTDIGGPVTVVGGVAALSHTFDTVGAHAITADFLAGAGFVSSSAAAQTVTVTAPSVDDVVTTTILEQITGVSQGQTVQLKATVTPGTATGTVQFKIGDLAIGAPVAVVNGVATLDHTFDTAGTVLVSAEFTGGEGFTDSAAIAQSVTVTAGPGNPSGGSDGFGSLENIFGS